VFQERLRCQVHGFGNRFVRDTPMPFLDNGFPVEPPGNLVQDIGDEDPCAAKRRLAVTHLGICNDEAPKDFHGLCFLHVLYPLMQSLLSAAGAEHSGSGVHRLRRVAPEPRVSLHCVITRLDDYRRDVAFLDHGQEPEPVREQYSSSVRHCRAMEQYLRQFGFLTIFAKNAVFKV